MNRGRPKGSKNTEKTKFIGLKLTKTMSDRLDRDADKHYRSKTGHILWILSNYLALDSTLPGPMYEKNGEPIEGRLKDYNGDDITE